MKKVAILAVFAFSCVYAMKEEDCDQKKLKKPSVKTQKILELYNPDYKIPSQDFLNTVILPIDTATSNSDSAQKITDFLEKDIEQKLAALSAQEKESFIASAFKHYPNHHILEAVMKITPEYREENRREFASDELAVATAAATLAVMFRLNNFDHTKGSSDSSVLDKAWGNWQKYLGDQPNMNPGFFFWRRLEVKLHKEKGLCTNERNGNFCEYLNAAITKTKDEGKVSLSEKAFEDLLIYIKKD